ncbi:hypothetical protein PHYSODRAFT_507869 [Phytophthora sojae]|uniref:PiggyBac transposable element-derived protein domain-containing protein n=1 Tax=Phytophthora sojae (strain P6497) TaxID=1094619 RepID=G4ZLA9_PHYSP|nr:hypothetical protein PHYSODRAFT_507869 [Phytophthora sojae]EGZ15955.1 hypothetical protein PHYSODRAFT_507869 [Phytophthora sojae]|eukprot:XP_009529704.1 hypothetical protein PHYSODRAFT_507869 [Phytophthora sojae]
MVELFFSKFSTFDVHDHLRQGSLAIEREWITQSWMHRVFGTILGMVVVDAYLAYRHESTERQFVESTVLNFSDFVSQLAHQLIFNEHTMKRTLRTDSGSTSTDEPSHTLKAFGDLPQYSEARKAGKRVQRQCRLCHKKCSYYCVGCSDVHLKSFYGVCGPRSHRACFSEHLASPSI